MKKILIPAAIILLLFTVIIYNANKSTSTKINGVIASTTNKTSITYKDGTYTGSKVINQYGTVQVQAVILNGKITDIKYLSLPSDLANSQAVSAYASPILKSEAISTQNANVNIVSGATQDSQSFIQSLGSALQSAQS